MSSIEYVCKDGMVFAGQNILCLYPPINKRFATTKDVEDIEQNIDI